MCLLLGNIVFTFRGFNHSFTPLFVTKCLRFLTKVYITTFIVMYGFNENNNYQCLTIVKSPISIVNDLFGNKMNCNIIKIGKRGQTFLCSIRTPLGSGESIGPSKKLAKHKAALKLITYLRSYCQNTNVVRYIDQFVFQGNSPFRFENETIKSRRRSRQHRSLQSFNDSSSECNKFYTNQTQHNWNKEGGRSRSRSRSRSRARSTNPLRYETDDFVSKLEEICTTNIFPLPNYSYIGKRSNGKIHVSITHKFTVREFQGYGKTLQEAKQAAAAALLEYIFRDAEN